MLHVLPSWSRCTPTYERRENGYGIIPVVMIMNTTKPTLHNQPMIMPHSPDEGWRDTLFSWLASKPPRTQGLQISPQRKKQNNTTEKAIHLEADMIGVCHPTLPATPSRRETGGQRDRKYPKPSSHRLEQSPQPILYTDDTKYHVEGNVLVAETRHKIDSSRKIQKSHFEPR